MHGVRPVRRLARPPGAEHGLHAYDDDRIFPQEFSDAAPRLRLVDRRPHVGLEPKPAVDPWRTLGSRLRAQIVMIALVAEGSSVGGVCIEGQLATHPGASP